jgi:hypothetical protein
VHGSNSSHHNTHEIILAAQAQALISQLRPATLALTLLPIHSQLRRRGIDGFVVLDKKRRDTTVRTCLPHNGDRRCGGVGLWVWQVSTPLLAHGKGAHQVEIFHKQGLVYFKKFCKIEIVAFSFVFDKYC